MRVNGAERPDKPIRYNRQHDQPDCQKDERIVEFLFAEHTADEMVNPFTGCEEDRDRNRDSCRDCG